MLKSALKAQNVPLGPLFLGTPLLPPCPQANGEKPSEPWVLLEVEFSLTHSQLEPSPPSHGWDGIPAVILLLVYPLCRLALPAAPK